ncbi:MAG: VCBS repeat-containing protein [Planctomycetota bacterium]|nr:VCBS repeat-containing protein [Planctomycetota bacterium]
MRLIFAKPMMKLFVVVFGIAFVPSLVTSQTTWKKHVVMEQGHCNTAVALDANGDRQLDVIASFKGRVSLFLAPNWSQETILHRFEGGVGACIHSTVLDVDDDGDLDWAGTVAHGHPFWLENPGRKKALQGAWTPRQIDPIITGIHCILASDIDNDGKQDLVINNFEPELGLGDSIAWFSVPRNPYKAKQWNRHVFADGDARGGSHYMGAGDIDGDGWKEIAVGAKGGPFADGNWFAFWTNPGKNGVKGKWKKTILAENQLAATNIVPADINGDGKVDWVATRGHSAGVLWFESPSWKIHEIDPRLKQPHSLTVADYDDDGDLDIASCGYESQSVRWYENDGSGNFKIRILDGSQQSYDLRTVDMDGDGDLDLLNAGRGSNNVVWYENRLK